MGCPECDRLARIFGALIGERRKLYAENRKAAEEADQLGLRRFETMLTSSSALILIARRELLAHETTHQPVPRVKDNGEIGSGV
jgi:hypothetical protein